MAKKLSILMEEQRYFLGGQEYGEQNQIEIQKLKKRQYKFLNMLIKDAIEKFPRSIDLKIVNAFV